MIPIPYHHPCPDARAFLTPPPVAPEEFFGFVSQASVETQKFYAIMAAEEIRLFDYLSLPKTLTELQEFFPHQELILPLLKILVNGGCILETDGKFVNAPLAQTYFSSGSPYYQGYYLEKIKRRVKELWADIPRLIRDGPVEYDKKEFFCDICLPPMAENAMTGRLQSVLRAIGSLPEFLSARRMLDLGGGHGLYAIALSSLKPDLTCVVFDLPEVIDRTGDYIIAHNMDEQVRLMPGDFFTDPIGSGYDIILSSSNPSGKSAGMIRKIYDSLNPGGIFVNIQSGDSPISENPLSQMESRMWALKGEAEWKSHRGRQQPFCSEEYLQKIRECGFTILQVEQIPDRCIEDYSVTMMICKKREDRTEWPCLVSLSSSGDMITFGLDGEKNWLKTAILFQISSF